MSTNTGGPAFPADGLVDEATGEHLFGASQGMTLLDWYAGQALVSVSLSYQAAKQTHASLEDVAGDAYMLAEAMLAEKARREGVVRNPLQLTTPAGWPSWRC